MKKSHFFMNHFQEVNPMEMIIKDEPIDSCIAIGNVYSASSNSIETSPGIYLGTVRAPIKAALN